MAQFYDISLWEEQEWFNTGGTRNKAVFQHPQDDSLYFFKTSLKKQDKDFKYEFWSEIISSEIGRYLGFNVLTYDIALNNNELGCISKIMINLIDESLIEGYRYLTAYDPNYSYEHKNGYTFQLIMNALKNRDLGQSIEDIVKIIIFDSIIGNGDRHQENWGFIQKLVITESRYFKKVKQAFSVTLEERFSPIYDSGSCLGREIVDAKISQLLSDETMLNSYIDRGKSEIHWEGNKINHFELIKKVNKEYNSVVSKEIQRVKERFDPQKVENIVMSVDKNLPDIFNGQKIPIERKKLIIKLITLRCARLISII